MILTGTGKLSIRLTLPDKYRGAGERPFELVLAIWRFGVMVLSGSVIAILSGEACFGKTVLALKLAVVLADESQCRVCLIELNPGRDDIARGLGLGTGSSLTAAMTADGHLDPDSLTHVIETYLNRVDCLFASVTPGESKRISAEFIEELLTTLRSRYDCVVIDTPAEMSSRVLAAIDSSTRHVQSTPETPAAASSSW